MKNAFYFITKALFGLVAKRLDEKDKINLLITAWLIHSRNTHTSQYSEKQSQSDNEIWSVNRM